LSIGMLVAFQALMSSFLAPVGSLVSLGSTLQDLEGDVLRLDDVLANPPVEASPARDAGLDGAPAASMRLQGDLEIKDVVFGYSPLDMPRIRNLSLRARPGQRIAVVGGSGCGKSTLSKLITGLYDPWEGQILFDGKARRELPGAVLDNSIGYVDQD